MAVYSQGKMLGIVGYKQLYPNSDLPQLQNLLEGLPRNWAITWVVNMQNKLVGKPFFNPDFNGEKVSQIDVPRFFFGPWNEQQSIDVIRRYNAQLELARKQHQVPMECATGEETPLLMLKHIMALPETDNTIDIPTLERKLFVAFMVANETTMNRDQGELPYKKEDDLEMYLASLLISRYAYNDYTNQKKELDELVRNQNIRTVSFFDFIRNHPQLKSLYDDFLVKYELSSWNDYLKTYWSVQTLARYKTGIINFKILKDEDHLLSDQIIEKESIDIHQHIPLADNVDYVAFREKPFIKIAPHEYAVIDVSFMIKRMFDGLYFIFNNLWQSKHPDKPNEFNRIYTTEFSEETILVANLKEVVNSHGWFSLTDKECKAIVPEQVLSSPPDFYIRKGKTIILFECKDVKIKRKTKTEGTIVQLLEEVDKNFVGYKDEKKKWRNKGVGQLVRNAKRIQDGIFKWDAEADKESRIYLVLVLADPKQVAWGWKNYLNRKMLEECIRQHVNVDRINPLILADLGTLALYTNNFKKHGFEYYFDQYLKKTAFNPRLIAVGNQMTNVMNQTMSFSNYMNGERILDGGKLGKRILEAIANKTKKDLDK